MPRLFILVWMAILLAGCSTPSVPLVSRTEIADLERMPQDAEAYVTQGGQPLTAVAPPEREEAFRRYWFAPWKRTEPSTCTPEEMFWAAESFLNKPVYGPNLLRWKKDSLDVLVANARVPEYPSLSGRGLLTRHADLRALPTRDPVFYSFEQAGEGYPFDNNQNSIAWAGTPVFVTHRSSDGRFLAVETPFTCGWVEAGSVVLLGEEDRASYSARPLRAVVQDQIALSDANGGFLLEGRIGMVLAESDDGGVLCPRDDGSFAQADPGATARMPFDLSEHAAAGLINEILGQPYGWGGVGGYRDCSAAQLDLFMAFGIGLPRNAGAQARSAPEIDMEDLANEEKKSLIAEQGQPFRTMLNIPGHNMLYIGIHEGEPAAFHAVWGIRTESSNGESQGRNVIGRAVITSLEPGIELPDVSPTKGNLLSRIRSMTILGDPQSEEQ